MPRFLSAAVVLATIVTCQGSRDEQRLVRDLFEKTGYNPLVRPVRNHTDVVVIHFSLVLFQVVTVEERNQIMKTNNWLRMVWTDYQLRWSPEDYGGISVIRLPCTHVWRPDIVLLNNADGNYEVSYCSNVVLNYTGGVDWLPPAIYKSSCTIDVEYFPFDQQECEMKFGSWTYNRDQVSLVVFDKRGLCELSDYVISGTWDLINCPAKIKFVPHKKTAEITYTIILRRKTLFYTINLLTPCVLVSFLSVLTFYLPSEAEEKITLCISILLALIVFLLLVSKSLPPTSVTIPLISKYLFFTFVMNIVTVIVAVALINVHFRSPGKYKMPRWIRITFISWLPTLLLMKRPEHDAKYKRWKERKLARKMAAGLMNGLVPNESKSHDLEKAFDFAFQSTNHRGVRPSNGSGDGGGRGRPDSNLWQRQQSGATARLEDEKVAKVAEAVEYITQHIKTKDDFEEICNDWKYVAAVIDRLLLYVSLGVTISGTVAIIIDAPHIFEFVNQVEILKTLIG